MAGLVPHCCLLRRLLALRILAIAFVAVSGAFFRLLRAHFRVVECIGTSVGCLILGPDLSACVGDLFLRRIPSVLPLAAMAARHLVQLRHT